MTICFLLSFFVAFLAPKMRWCSQCMALLCSTKVCVTNSTEVRRGGASLNISCSVHFIYEFRCCLGWSDGIEAAAHLSQKIYGMVGFASNSRSNFFFSVLLVINWFLIAFQFIKSILFRILHFISISFHLIAGPWTHTFVSLLYFASHFL